MKKTILSLILLLGLLCAPLTANAASMSAFIDADAYAEVGKEFALTVRYESDAEAFVQATLSYDSSVVSFVRASSSDAHDTGGSINIVPMSSSTSTKVTLYFKMNKEAAARFTTRVLESYTIDMTSLGTPSAEKTVTGFYPTPVPSTPTPTLPPTPTPTPFIPTIDPSATPSTPLEFMDNGNMRFISENFSEENVSLPAGFTKTSYSFRGNDIFVAQSEHGVILIYATDLVGRNGKFYLYDAKNDAIHAYTTFAVGENVYTFLIPSEPLPDGFVETSVKIGEYENITAYTIPDVKYAEFVMVYAFNKTAAPSFYLYDLTEGTLQRCADLNRFGGSGTVNVPATASPKSTERPFTTSTAKVALADIGNGRFSTRTIVFLIVGLCVAAAVAAIIVIIVKSRGIDESYEAEKEPAEEAPSPEQNAEESPETVPEEESNEDTQADNSQNQDDDDVLQLSNRFTR